MLADAVGVERSAATPASAYADHRRQKALT
jgi:hypothetical protein